LFTNDNCEAVVENSTQTGNDTFGNFVSFQCTSDGIGQIILCDDSGCSSNCQIIRSYNSSRCDNSDFQETYISWDCQSNANSAAATELLPLAHQSFLLEFENKPNDNHTWTEMELAKDSIAANIIGIFQDCRPYGDGTWYYSVGSGTEVVMKICADSACKTNCTTRFDLQLGCDLSLDDGENATFYTYSLIVKGISGLELQQLQTLNKTGDYLYFGYYGLDSSCQISSFEELDILNNNSSCLQTGDTFETFKCNDGMFLHLANCLDDQCTQNCTTVETHQENTCELGPFGYQKVSCGSELTF